MALPKWKQSELPAAPPFNLRNFFRVIGPGTILLATSIGGGEWLLGPAAALKYGVGILGIVPVSVLLQVVFNIETMRYTLATGEPIFTGFMRLSRRTWPAGLLYVAFGFLQIGWPALAATSASALFAAFSGRLPQAADAGSLYYYGLFTFLLAFVVLLFGRTIERTLEIASFAMMIWVFGFLLIVNVLFVPLSVSIETAKGFLFFGEIPSGMDWTLIGGFAAYAGAGGVVNLLLSNWARDKGFGMGASMGAISAATSARVTLSPTGNIFPTDDNNLARWRVWMRYLHVEQFVVWGAFCILGMYLTVNMTLAFVPQGVDLTGIAAGAYPAEYLSKTVGSWMWLLTLLNGFWILFSTQLALMDGLVRLTTDILWTAFPRLRDAVRNDVRKLYYGLLVASVLWGCVALQLAQPITLVLIAANAAGFILTFTAIHIILMNRRLLPEALRPSRFREAILVLVSLFFGFFVLMNFM
jgi:hypothetical protein